MLSRVGWRQTKQIFTLNAVEPAVGRQKLTLRAGRLANAGARLLEIFPLHRMAGRVLAAARKAWLKEAKGTEREVREQSDFLLFSRISHLTPCVLA